MIPEKLRRPPEAPKTPIAAGNQMRDHFRQLARLTGNPTEENDLITWSKTVDDATLAREGPLKVRDALAGGSKRGDKKSVQIQNAFSQWGANYGSPAGAPFSHVRRPATRGFDGCGR